MTGNNSDKSTVTLLPQTQGNLLCVRYSRIIKRADYEIAYKAVKKMASTGQKFRLLVDFSKDFQGWEEDAAEMNFKSIIEYAPMALKVAYVNPPHGKILQMKLMEPAVFGDVRNFDSDEFDKAMAWLNEN